MKNVDAHACLYSKFIVTMSWIIILLFFLSFKHSDVRVFSMIFAIVLTYPIEA